jgi:hypothetical protein
MFTHVFNASLVTVVLSGVSLKPQILVFLLYYSYFPEDKVPDQDVYTDLYNCSVNFFPMFRKHVDCNGVTECEGGEDEGDHCYACQFTHPADTGRCPFCPGGVAAPRNGKCYSFENVTNAHEAKDFNEFLPLARETCQLNGGRVAFPKSPLDLDTLQVIKPTKNNNCFETSEKPYFSHSFLGMMYGGLSIPNLYR